ncbi:error-prone DNA polymerase [Haloferula sp. BvORR071]|uniref:DNA polymerase III subunit alpha n=1 Tax=Haloferula sp. BvORR071 TaxID=1396141 RepID=UPI00054EC38D|nr:error-prone DNA polymerase [Haloferula sp. BvORR071]
MKARLPFHEFHARSAFSFLRGASDPETLMERAANIGLTTVAITDHEGYYGSARAYHEAQKRGIRAITGATLEIDDAHVPVLCATRDGYRTLSRHLTNRHLKEAVAHDEMNRGDLIALTGDREGPVIRQLLRDNREAALLAARSLIHTFGYGNVYVEILRHGLRDDAKLNRCLIDLARQLRLPLLASNAPLYAVRENRLLADAFTCLRHHTSLDAAGLLLEPNGERHLKSPAQMAQLFADLPEALENTQALSDRIDFTLEKLGYEFPAFADESGRLMTLPEQTEYLKWKCEEGLHRRYTDITPEIRATLKKEISLIGKLELSGYFLIVQDIVRYARDEGILCQGRGSAANSVVCYVLGITSIDAVAQKLVFERFLSEGPTKKEYKSWPDIDIDFPSGDQREKVIQYVFKKYGARGAAMTANVITYRGKSAFREMSKVLGFPPSIADRFSSLGSTPYHWKRSDDAPPPTAEEIEAERQDAFEGQMANLLPPSHPRLMALNKLYHAVLGLPRHLGQHSGGMVICNQGLDEVVPIQPASMLGRTIVQWDKDDCEDLGLVKIDLLGLGMLAAMENMIEVRRRKEPDFELAGINLEDKSVYDLMQRSDTVGTFQVESRAQMATLSILQPASFYEVAIQVAIVRPGPIVGGLLHPYLRRRKGVEKADWIHPSFEPVLKRTLGVPLFQEQVLKMAEIIAGFTGNEAAQLRKAMSFNRSDKRMREVTDKLRERMKERAVSKEVQDKVVDAVGNFALYGFPESHALSFASIAYWSCWFKVHEPAAFYTGLLNNQPMGFYSAHSLIQDAKRHGVQVLPASCLHSLVTTEVVEKMSIRLGLHRLRGISNETQEKIVVERNKSQFDSLQDFLFRVAPNAKERRILAKSGALNELPKVEHRRKAMWQVELPLYGDLLESSARIAEGDREVLSAMSMPERLASDLAIQGASTGPHPMKLWRPSHPELKLVNARDLQNLAHGMSVRVGGLVICRQRPSTAKGHCFISLEDETGISNLFVKKENFQRQRLTIVSEPFLMAAGRVQVSEGGQRTIFVDEVFPLPGAEPVHATDSHDFH